MNRQQFCDVLRELQKNEYLWPNAYFEWKKPDGQLFVIGLHSNQLFQVLLYEERGEQYPACHLYGISPNVCYYSNNGRYDPVEQLADRVGEYEYIGTWADQDVLMEDNHGFGRKAACGRWELAKERIQLGKGA